MSHTPLESAVTPAGTVSARSLPCVAYRGLWDKFAAPGTLGAVRRAYLRGVPSLVRPDGDLTIAAATALAGDPAVNRLHQPLYLMLSCLAPIELRTGTLASLFAVVPGSAAHQPWPMSRWSGNAWVPAGCYVPLGAALHLSLFESDPPAHVLFESASVLIDFEQQAAAGVVDDEATLASIRQAWGSGSARASLPDSGIARVTDLVEVEQLERIREAA